MNYSKRFGLIIVSVLLFILVWYSSFYSPNTEKLQQSELRMVELKNQLDALGNMSMSIDEFQTKVDSLKNVFEQELSIFQDKSQFNSRIQNMRELSIAAGVNVNVINPSVTNSLNVAQNLQVRNLGYIVVQNTIMIQLTGKYLNVGNFLELLDQKDGIFINRVEILSDPVVYPELNVFAYLFMYSRVGV